MDEKDKNLVKQTDKNKEDKYNVNDFDYLKNAACDTDMTGLIYRAITDDEEIESYEEVFQYLPPVDKTK